MVTTQFSKKGIILVLLVLLIGLNVLPILNGTSVSEKENRRLSFSSEQFLSPPGAYTTYPKFLEHETVCTEKNHTMLVTVTPTTSYAGVSVEYDINISLLEGGHPAASGLTVALYDSTGDLVTGDDALIIVGDYEITNYEHVLSGGTYYIYAYNATDDSQGNNATLVINKFTVISSPPVLAWKIDTNVNIIFTVIPQTYGNGTLTLNNMSCQPNASYPGQYCQISIEAGVGILNGVNATTLGNVTYDYTPDGGNQRPADGLLQIVLPTVTPDPLTLYVGELSTVTITVTHPVNSDPLEGMNITLEIPGLDEVYSQSTDIDGKVSFTFEPLIAGEIIIKINNQTSDVTIHIVSDHNNTPPIADFSWTAQDLLVTFIDQSIDLDGVITSWQWNFWNGYWSTLQNPIFEYFHKGIYTVTLTVTDDQLGTDVISKTITVGTPPVANFTYAPQNPTNTTLVSFTDTSTDNGAVITTWWWNFGDQYYSDLQNPAHCYQTDGTYIVTFTVTDNYGMTNSTQQTITIVTPLNHPPYQPKIYGPYSGFVNVEYSFTTDPITDPDSDQMYCFWDWGDGNNSGWLGPHLSGQILYASHTWTTEGTYGLRLKLKDDPGLESNWSDLFNITITEYQPPTPPIIVGPDWGIINGKYSFCLNGTDINGDFVYCLWNWGDGNISEWLGPFPSNDTVCASHSWSQKGIYEIRLKLKDEFGTESDWSNLHTITIHKIGIAILFGTYENLSEDGDEITIKAVNIRMMFFIPIQFLHYTSGETITFSKEYIGFIRGRFIITLVNFEK
jgi:PKD repeat protein